MAVLASLGVGRTELRCKATLVLGKGGRLSTETFFNTTNVGAGA